MSEALRIYPPVWVTARMAAMTYEYRGLTIPAGSLLLLPQIAIHRDPRWYPQPMHFNPDRFLPEAAQRVRAMRTSLLAPARAFALEKTLRGWRRFWCLPASFATGALSFLVQPRKNFH